MDSARGRTAEILEARLDQLNAEIERLREQQRIIVRLLADPKKLRRARALDKDGWVAILRATGLDDADMHRWHVEFERMAPKAHHDFLQSLGLSPAVAARIRRQSRQPQTNGASQPSVTSPDSASPSRGRTQR